MKITREIINYTVTSTGKSVEHYILIANNGSLNTLLSHPNLFLYEKTCSSLQTSNRYSSVIAMFYSYLTRQEKFYGLSLSQYHVLATNDDIKKWQVSRQIERVRLQKERPSSETIYEDAKVLLVFFNWLRESGYVTNVSVEKTTWVANFRNDSLLTHIRKQASVGLSFKNIDVLDKERRQKTLKSLITKYEIDALISSFSDPVYATMFKLALGTAMRPMDLCKFPYIGNGQNKHILPFSEMSFGQNNTVSYQVRASKGNKTRTIQINKKDLEILEREYIIPYYFERANKYEEVHGHKCSPDILFLNKYGRPINPAMISSRANDAKKFALEKYPEFRERVTFYDARDWWPTMFLIKFFGDRLLTDSADALYLAAAQALKDQMGHEDISTTYKHYVDKARVFALANKGFVNEIVTGEQTVHEFIEDIS